LSKASENSGCPNGDKGGLRSFGGFFVECGNTNKLVVGTVMFKF